MIANKKAVPGALPRAPTGMPGFNELSHGGLQRNRTALVMGGPGTGQTVFAPQTLVGAAGYRRGA